MSIKRKSKIKRPEILQNPFQDNTSLKGSEFKGTGIKKYKEAMIFDTWQACVDRNGFPP